MTTIFVAQHIGFHTLGQSAALNAIFDDIAAKMTAHIAGTDYVHPDLANATAVGDQTTPNGLYLVKRDATGRIGVTGATLTGPPNVAVLTVNLIGATQVGAYNVFQLLNNNGLLMAVDQYGNASIVGLVSAANGAFTGVGNGATVLGVRAPATPSVDVYYVGDNAGTLANRYLRVASAGANVPLGGVVARLGLYTGAAGSEIFALDQFGNILTRRSHREFSIAFSTVALTGTVGAGKFIDANGVPYTKSTATTFTATSHATLYVWWALSWQAGGTLRFVANTAGGNTVAGSALQAPMSNPSDEPIGWVLVPPNVTNLTNAVFDDYRGAKTGDGNAALGSAVQASSGIITNTDESATYANSKQLASVAAGLTTVTGPPTLTAAGKLATHIRSAFTDNTNYDASLENRLWTDFAPHLPAQIGVSGTAFQVASGVNFPGWIAISGKWRTNTTTITSGNASGGAGVRYCIATCSAALPGTYTIRLDPSASIGANERVIAAAWWDGSALTSLDVGPLLKLSYAQYAPRLVTATAVATAIGTYAAGITGGPTITINVPNQATVSVRWKVDYSGSAIGWTQFSLTQNFAGGSFSAVGPYSDIEYLTSGHTNRGSTNGEVDLLIAAGVSQFRIGGQQATGTAVVPNSAWIYATIFGA